MKHFSKIKLSFLGFSFSCVILILFLYNLQGIDYHGNRFGIISGAVLLGINKGSTVGNIGWLHKFSDNIVIDWWPHYISSRGINLVPLKYLVIPLWIPFVVVTSISLLLLRKGRQPPGHCQRCSYNLTGNESGVCPECGTEIKS